MKDLYGKQMVGASDIIVEVTLVCTTTQYSDVDVLSDRVEIPLACFTNGTCALQSIRLLDNDDQAGALDLLILRSDTSIGTVNAAFAPADTVADEILTVVPFSAGDYVDLVNSQMAVKSLGDYGMGVKLAPSDNTATSLYVAAVSRDTKTYAVSGIELLLGFMRD